MAINTKCVLGIGLLALLGAGRASQKQHIWEPTQEWLDSSRHIYWRPKGGYVKDQQTALAIGTAVIAGVLGEEWVKGTGPYHAKLLGEVWVVYSDFPDKPVMPGGVTSVQIDKTTGTVLQLISER